VKFEVKYLDLIAIIYELLEVKYLDLIAFIYMRNSSPQKK